MDLREQMVSSETIFEGKIIKVALDQARLPDGALAAREVVYHPGGVAVLALDEDNTVYLVRQYRYPIQQLLLELPAGKLDHGAEEDRLLRRSGPTWAAYWLPPASATRFCTCIWPGG